MKKLFAVLVALALVLSMGVMAFAADTGSIKITNALDGATYNAYRIFDLESYDAEGHYSYKLSAKWAGFTAADYFEINEAGYVEWLKSFEDDAEDVIAFVELAHTYAKTNNITPDGTATADGTSVTIDSLLLGYYLVDTSVGALCAITTTATAAEVKEKNAKPDLVKKIVEGAERVDANNVAIGDTVTYETVVTVGKGLTDYVVHDIMSAGLTMVDSADDADEIIDVTVTVDGENGRETVDASNYTVTNVATTDGYAFDVSFKNAYIAGLDKETKIYITYSAVLNDDALVGATGNPNTAQLDYKNESEIENTKPDTVLTYTTKFVVDKVDAEKNPLAGAGFTLYKGSGDTKEAIGEEIKGENITTFTWTGLAEGTYTLVETTVPEGYNKAKDIVFTITCDEPEEVTAVTDTANWDETASEDVIESVDEGGKALDVFEATVVNKTGALLPETGGIGTTIFYVVGGLMMVAAVVFLVSKKRMASFA